MSCNKNPYAPYVGCPSTSPCCTTLCPCGPAGPTGPAGLSGSGAFAVAFSGTATVPTTLGFYVPFNLFTASSSGSYLIGTGAYQAPVTGLYVISPTIGYAFTAAGTIVTSIIQNGVARLQTYTTVTAASDASTAFSTVMTLFAGDIIQIQSQAQGTAAGTLISGVYPSFQTSLSILPLA